MDAAIETDVSASRTFALGEISALQSSLTELANGSQLDTLLDIADTVVEALRSGRKCMFCGNGGSAADAQHLSAELVGKQNYDRAPLAGVALTVDTSALTALGNDYGYETIFARQVQAIANPGDVLFGISTSGRSKSVVAALETASSLGVTTVAFTGDDPRDMGKADFVYRAPATHTAKIQELHITGGHIVFALVESAMFPKQLNLQAP